MTDPIAAARALIAAQPDLLFRCDLCPVECDCHPHHDMSMSGGNILCDGCADFEAAATLPDPLNLIATLADALEDSRMTEAALRDTLRDVERERDAAASLRPLWMDEAVTPQVIAAALAQLWEKLGATTQTEACGNLDKMLAEARLDGWRAGRDAAAQVAEAKCDRRSQYALAQSCKDAIRALLEPKETSHDD